jgi:hypothetical protein
MKSSKSGASGCGHIHGYLGAFSWIALHRGALIALAAYSHKLWRAVGFTFRSEDNFALRPTTSFSLPVVAEFDSLHQTQGARTSRFRSDAPSALARRTGPEGPQDGKGSRSRASYRRPRFTDWQIPQLEHHVLTRRHDQSKPPFGDLLHDLLRICGRFTVVAAVCRDAATGRRWPEWCASAFERFPRPFYRPPSSPAVVARQQASSVSVQVDLPSWSSASK